MKKTKTKKLLLLLLLLLSIVVYVIKCNTCELIEIQDRKTSARLGIQKYVHR